MLNDISPYLGLTVLNADVCPDCSASITATRSALGIPVLRVNHSATCPIGSPRARRRARIRRAKAAIASHLEAAR